MISPKALYDARPSLRGLPEWWRGRSTLSEVLPGLYMGGFPRKALLEQLLSLEVDHVVSATFDLPHVPGTSLARAPFYDIALPKDLSPQVAVARDAAERYRAGQRIYVSCGHGHDRSGLLMGLILHELHPEWSGAQIVALIRARRGREALHNRRFARFVTELPASLESALPSAFRQTGA